MIDYIFFKLFKFSLAIEKRNTPEAVRSPHWSAIFTFSILIGFNMLEIAILFRNQLSNINFSKVDAVIIGLVLYLISYFLFLYKRRYLEILKKYDNISTSETKIKEVCFWIYIIGTLAILFLIIPLIVEPPQR